MSERYRTVIESDEPLAVTVTTSGDGRWFKLFHAVVESGAWARMSPAAGKVLIVLASHANEQWMAWPGISTIQGRTGLARRSVYRAIDELERAQVLRRRTRGGGSTATTYELTEPPFTGPLFTSSSRARPVPAVAPPPCQEWHPPRASSGTRSRTMEQAPMNSSSGAAAEVVAALTEAGIAEPARSALAQHPAADVDVIRRAAAEARRAGKGTGALVLNLRSAFERHLVAVAARVKARHAERVAEEERVNERARYRERSDKLAAWLDATPPHRLAELRRQVLAGLPAASRDVLGRLDIHESRTLANLAWELDHQPAGD